jgi:hypothetical protein
MTLIEHELNMTAGQEGRRILLKSATRSSGLLDNGGRAGAE